MVTGSQDGTAKLWNPNSGKCVGTLLSDKGQQGSTMLAKLWNPNSGKCVGTLLSDKGQQGSTMLRCAGSSTQYPTSIKN